MNLLNNQQPWPRHVFVTKVIMRLKTRPHESLSATTPLWYKKWRDCTWACWIPHQLTFETLCACFFTLHQLSWTLPSVLPAKNARIVFRRFMRTLVVGRMSILQTWSMIIFVEYSITKRKQEQRMMRCKCAFLSSIMYPHISSMPMFFNKESGEKRESK